MKTCFLCEKKAIDIIKMLGMKYPLCFTHYYDLKKNILKNFMEQKKK
jgi:hypothetical protein